MIKTRVFDVFRKSKQIKKKHKQSVGANRSTYADGNTVKVWSSPLTEAMLEVERSDGNLDFLDHGFFFCWASGGERWKNMGSLTYS